MLTFLTATAGTTAVNIALALARVGCTVAKARYYYKNSK